MLKFVVGKRRGVEIRYIVLNTFGDHLAAEQSAMMDRCRAYDGQGCANRHFKRSEALPPPAIAMTLSYTNGHLVVTDGPCAEIKAHPAESPHHNNGHCWLTFVQLHRK